MNASLYNIILYYNIIKEAIFMSILENAIQKQLQYVPEDKRELYLELVSNKPDLNFNLLRLVSQALRFNKPRTFIESILEKPYNEETLDWYHTELPKMN